MKKILFILFFVLVFAFLLPHFVLAEQIDINSATLPQLDELTGIGPAYAQRIIDDRPYSSVDDLLRVKGIGTATLQKIKDQGLACVNCGSTQANFETQISNSETNSNSQNSNVQNTIPNTYSNGIYINEILANPAGADETNEWIELYNSNNSDVDLSDWQIQDTEGTATTFTIPQNTKILANGFLVFKRPDTKIMLNNDEDGLNLLAPDKKTIDSVNYTKALLGQSYNKTSFGWEYSTTLTPETKNIITAVATKKKSPSTSSGSDDLSNAKNSVNNKNAEAGLADLSQTANPWFLFFAALAITIILAIIVLFIKLKIFKNHVRT
ncbi:MAG: lamin tail domain-containing protein [Candidatus Staskawiczbacteria bacterium]|nr:lamin tail domain-containing protein [Candidatus Staskawiczbacteria bacterium]